MKTTGGEQEHVAFAIARAAVAELRDTGAMAMAETAEPLELDDDDIDAIGNHISGIADDIDVFLDLLEEMR